MRPRILALGLSLIVATQLHALALTEVFVSGVTASEQDYVKSILPLAAGDVFASVGDLEKRAKLAESFLRQDGHFANVSIEIEEISESEAAAYVLLHDAAIGALSVFDSTFTVIPHFPLYASGFGFLIGAYEQSIALDLPLSRRLRVDFVSGHAQTISGTHAVSTKAGFNFSPLPLLSFYLPVEVDAYPRSDQVWLLDSAIGGGAKLDLSFFEGATPFGGSLEASARRGLAEFDYASVKSAAALSFHPLPFFSLLSVAEVYALSGAAAVLGTVNDVGGKSLRVAPLAAIAGTGVALASGTGKLSLPLRLHLGIMSLSISAFGFYEAWRSFEAVSDLRQGPWSGSTGAGLMIELSPPFSLTVEIGYGYSIAESRSLLLFSVR